LQWCATFRGGYMTARTKEVNTLFEEKFDKIFHHRLTLKWRALYPR